MGLTGDDIRNFRFRKPAIGRRGYRREDVEAFLARVASALDGSGPAVTASEIHDAAFRKPPIGNRGYDEQQVDDLLDQIEAESKVRFGA